MLILGALQILIALACATFGLFIASGSELAMRQGASSSAALASGLVAYGVATVYFVSVGIGSIRRRRWAHALIVVSAMWLAAGVVTTLLLAIERSGATLVGIAFVLAIVLPLILLLYYRRPAVRAEFEASDGPRWTDRVPLPVLAVAYIRRYFAVDTRPRTREGDVAARTII